MTDFTAFHHVIHERITNPNASYYEDPWWDAEIKQFTLDMDMSIRFIQTECTDEELYWLGEVFDDIMEKSRSVAFLNALRERVKHVENSQWRSVLEECLRTAAEYIDED